MRIQVTRNAAAQIEEAAVWWAKNRPLAPGAIEEELERSFALLAVQPAIGALARSDQLHGVRRVHLSRIHYYLYYRVSAKAIDVLAFWHTSRGSPPSCVNEGSRAVSPLAECGDNV